MPRARLSISFFATVLLSVDFVTAGPPVVNYFYPAGAQRGATTSITASGTFDKWPVKVWTDRSGVTIEAEKDKGKLKITLAPEVEPGLCLIRLYNDDGAAALRPFIIGAIAEVNETEPNNDLEKPQAIDKSAVVNGKLQASGDVDLFKVSLKKDQTLVAAMIANRLLASPMDGVLQICTSDGFVLAQNDDERDVDPLIAFTAPRDGEYVVRTFAFPLTANSTIGFAGADTFVYRLTLTTDGFIDHAMPMSASPNSTSAITLHGWNIPSAASSWNVVAQDGAAHCWVNQTDLAGLLCIPFGGEPPAVANQESSPATPQSISLPAIITGKIEAAGDIDTFRFEAKKGQKLDMQVESRSLGYPLDSVLKLTDATGKLLKEVDDVSQKTDATISQAIAADGLYDLSISDLHSFGGERFVYRLTIKESQPDYSLAVAADAFNSTDGKPLEVPVTITRLNGFAEEINITVEGLPAGVKAEPVVSQAKGDTAKSVKLKLTSDEKLAQGNFQIVGQVAEKKESNRHATFAIPAANTLSRDLWFTIVGKK